MKVLSILLRNFRRYEDALFHFHPHFTVLIGENGKGKTTILDALAVMLGTYFQGSKIQIGQSVIRKEDARFIEQEKGGQFFLEPQREVYLSAESITNGERLNWCREIGDRGGKAKNFIQKGAEDRKNISEGKNVEPPLLLYYGVGRLWDLHRDVKPDKPGSRLDAYRFCLDPKSDQKAFEKWFNKLTYAELQKKQTIPVLHAVKNAVLKCIPNAGDFYFDTNENQIIIKIDGEGSIPFNNLSDGYRNMVAMVADIAYRAALLNPHLEADAAEQTKGIILIDEIDLHLHPKWQRKVVRDLQSAFPKMQFIATTHSPFIIQSLEPGEVIDLNRPATKEEVENAQAGVAAPGSANTYSNRSIEDILEDIMGMPVPQRSERYQDMFDTAKQYYQIQQQAETATPEEKNNL